MTISKAQSNFFFLFFAGTEILNWEGRSTIGENGQRLKTYPRRRRLQLPKPGLPFHLSLADVLIRRHSAQELKTERFTLLEISTLLASVGLSPHQKTSNESRRTYPSAGARYPGEIYLIALDCEAISPGLYHYALNDHELEKLWTQDLRETLVAATNDQRLLSASVVLIFSLVYGRVAEKYGDRGLRYGLIELGHMAQNVSLTATALQKGCYDIGGFVDSAVNTWLDVDTETEAAALLMVMGGETG